MFSHRHSCDRCRQQKVRCLKARDSPPTVAGSGLESHGTCERCAKADVPCVYSLKQKNRRAAADLGRDDGDTSPLRSRRFSQDLSGMFLGNEGPVSGLGDIAMRMLDMGGTAVHDFNDSYQYGWSHPHSSHNSHNSSLSLLPLTGQNGDCTDIRTTQGGLDTSPHVSRTQTGVDSFGSSNAGGPGVGAFGACGSQSDLAGQVMALSNRATRAVRQLDSAESGTSLTVNSPVVSEAFEIANALIRIINSTDLASPSPNLMSVPASSASQPSPHGSDESVPIVDYGLVFQEFACHQHMLTLFGSICSSIKRSLASPSISLDTSHHQHSQHPLHGDGVSYAQFTMIMQLIVHLVNRLSRSLRLESKGTTSARPDSQMDDSSLFNTSVLTPTLDASSESSGSGSGSGSRHGSPSCLVDLAQEMLGRLPDEHVKLKRTIQELQTRMEEGI